MITINNTALKAAIKKHSSKPTPLAFQAGSSPTVMDKLLNDETDFTIKSAHKIAEYLGFDVVVEFVPRTNDLLKQ